MLVGELITRGRAPPLRAPPPIWALAGAFIGELLIGELDGSLVGSLVGDIFEGPRISPVRSKIIWALFPLSEIGETVGLLAEPLVGREVGGLEVGSLVGSVVGDTVHDMGNAAGSNTGVGV
jgi:hypothetical protein